ncbi:type II secretion system F family protein [Candidatus Pacearchaeota archaeon]|nr:type II secretion system F family protein [Candidatus Pacearchaeota archaeon]
MKFRIPFSMFSLDRLKKRSLFLKRFVKYKKDSLLEDRLANTDSGLKREEYLAICLNGFVNSFLLFFILSSTALLLFGVNRALLFSFGLSLLFGLFIFFSRKVYPKVYSNRKEKEIERNLIPALEDILVQLNSGIPLFSIMINISSSDYGALSEEFKKAVRRINAGLPQVDVLEELGEKNPSIFFRRTLWQISNGMRAGSDISIIIRESIKSLSEEQLIQIQNYGNKLNPLIMFYMLISVIIPSLSITFLTIISSIVNLAENITKMLFVGLFVFVVLIQFMFLGIIKSIRPSLL